MKKILFWLCLAFSASIILSCTSSPSSKPGKPMSAVADSQLTPDEQQDYQLALKQLGAGELAKAEKTLTKLSHVHAKHIGIWLNLAITCYQTGEIERASTALNHAKEIDAGIAEIYNLSGLIAIERGEYNAAEKHYLAALKINKEYANAHYNLALLYDVFYQDLDQAINHYQDYLTLVSGEDKDTILWVEELKLSLKRRDKE